MAPPIITAAVISKSRETAKQSAFYSSMGFLFAPLVLALLLAVAESFSPAPMLIPATSRRGYDLPRPLSSTRIKSSSQINGGDQVQEPLTPQERSQQSLPSIDQRKRGQTLCPQQLFYPEIASLLGTTKDNIDREEDSRGVPFYQAFRAIKKALEKIAYATPDELSLLLGGEFLVASGSQSTSAGVSVLRIEQAISHSVDPLAWMYAQNQRQINLSNNNNNNNKDALFYIQSTVETAVFGAAWTWDQPTNSGDQKEEFWKTVSSLPEDSHLYGGERFDTYAFQTSSNNNNNNNNSQKRHSHWKDFGSTWWVLPAVELREEPVEQVLATTTNNDVTSTSKRTTLAIHLVVDNKNNDNSIASSSPWQKAARETLQILQRLNDAVVDAQVPATTLPPVVTRESTYQGPDMCEVDGQDLYEQGVTAALEAFAEGDDEDSAQQQHDKEGLQKVVLARRMDLQFEAHLCALDILRKWKYNEVHEGGNMFYMRPLGQEEFFGCTPERLFTIQKNSKEVLSEALAGTRPRGSSQAADEELLRDLFGSLKDRNENAITANFIRDVFTKLGEEGLVETTETLPSASIVEDEPNSPKPVTNESSTRKTSSNSSGYFVRRLRHLQHICQRFSAKLPDTDITCDPGDANYVKVIQHLLENLHPTPAVCGYPAGPAMDFIRQHESIGFDRGFYAGPVGFLGRNAADILVAIRSGLISHADNQASHTGDYGQDGLVSYSPRTILSVYAGAGLVPGSTVQGEWAETSYKLGVISSLFPQSPMTLQSAPTANAAWAGAFVEELIRNGITQFYVCPGSRSTPLVVAIAKAARSNVGVVNAVSVHDERGAGFRAIGYGRGASRPAAVITSSGTAIANLYPAIIEAGMDGVPMLVLTADRPYENRDTGANQAIDQVKAFSSSYVRWFRDILPPHDDVPVSTALADAGHAVLVARSQRGPVHVNIQFRENLAPDVGPVRNDHRSKKLSTFDGFRFTDAPGFSRWSTSGNRWQRSYQLLSGDLGMGVPHSAVAEIVRLIMESRRGIIVVGNIRRPTDENDMEALAATYEVISDFAKTIGFPIVAGAQNAHLRFSSPAVIPFADHILKNPTVSQNIKPDLIFQIGAPLVSAEIPSLIANALKDNAPEAHHILLHPHHGTERADPLFTVSRRVSAEISPFLKAVSCHLNTRDLCKHGCSSELAPLVRLGRQLQKEVPTIISKASEAVQDSKASLTEPQVMLVLAMMMSNSLLDQSIFLSNSMPIRDAEFFLYPTNLPEAQKPNGSDQRGLFNVGSNRGASGIDGIVASATGFAESTGAPTTLLIGDLSALHDLNSFFSLTSGTTSAKKPLTTILVNNDGGGIFSFLPIAKHGADVSFDDFFGTPTNTFSYKQGLEAFGLTTRSVSRFDSLCTAYTEAMRSNESSVIEAKVVSREVNVEIHKQVTVGINALIEDILSDDCETLHGEQLPFKRYSEPSTNATVENRKTFVMLHGWMGDKTEWDETGASIATALGNEWDILSLDLPAHGASKRVLSSDRNALRSALGLRTKSQHLSVDGMAEAVLESLSRDHGIDQIDALAGYSLGGRVALAMKRLSSSTPSAVPALVKDNSKLILLSTYPGVLPEADGSIVQATAADGLIRLSSDEKLAREIRAICDRTELMSSSLLTRLSLWSEFLLQWYGMPMWGNLQSKETHFTPLIEKRGKELSYRGRDLAELLCQSSPPRNSREDWRGTFPRNTLYLAGDRDAKYLAIGRSWSKEGIRFVEMPNSGHALLVQAADRVSEEMANFVLSDDNGSDVDQEGAVDSIEKLKANNYTLTTTETSNKEEADISAWENQMDAWKFTRSIDSLDFDPFVIDLVGENTEQKGVFGVGWGDQAKKSNQIANRSGFIIQLVTYSGSKVGLGEVSPLTGLHPESLEEAEVQLVALKEYLDNTRGDTKFSAPSVLALDGDLRRYIDDLAGDVGVPEFSPSVRSGLEMALISLASQVVQSPMHEALVKFAPRHSTPAPLDALLPVNGLITRGLVYLQSLQKNNDRSFPSLKVKIGHQDVMEDAEAVSHALHQSESYKGSVPGTIRADANRAWDDDSAIQFASALEGTNIRALERIEFVEEPLKRQGVNEWALEAQVFALERWHKHTGIPYALDESLADLAESNSYDFQSIRKELTSSFGSENRGCAAFVIKPSLIGLELSLQIARMARSELGIGVAFSSSFDSGVGLAYASMLAAISDATAGTKKYSHGVGTFTMLESDTLSPAFASYVNIFGMLKIASLSRALNGLGLDELRDSRVFYELQAGGTSPALELPTKTSDKDADNYEAATATSSSGREINLVVSLPLPFSADIAVSRFTDFPQQSRWSPWIRSVRYLDDGRETEWTMNVRGVQFKWRAISSPLEPPLKGIKWESISGLKNKGFVEFDATEQDACLMKVRMSIMTPRIVASIFQTSIFVEDFLQNKLLKWSLEMFRDVVKGDLALQRGDAELGDALFSSVEGKANAIEATLGMSSPFLDDKDDVQ